MMHSGYAFCVFFLFRIYVMRDDLKLPWNALSWTILMEITGAVEEKVIAPNLIFKLKFIKFVITSKPNY